VQDEAAGEITVETGLIYTYSEPAGGMPAVPEAVLMVALSTGRVANARIPSKVDRCTSILKEAGCDAKLTATRQAPAMKVYTSYLPHSSYSV
jgi:hypothetical protein